MADKFKELFEEARDSGVDADWVDRLENTFEASGLRKDNNAMKDRWIAASEENKTLKAGLLKTRFTELGITLDPSILALPETLNPADPDNVRTWAIASGLIEDTPTTPPAERATHDRIAAAADQTTNHTIPNYDDLDPTKMDEDTFYKVAAQREAAIKAKL